MSEVTVAQLDALIDEYFQIKKEAEAIEDTLTGKNKEMGALKGRIVGYLKELNREGYETPLARVAIKQKWRVNLPKTDFDKAALFEHLRERGIFEAYATVNSNSLNALYMQDWETAKARGEAMTFSMPGIGAPSLFEDADLKLKRGVKL